MKTWFYIIAYGLLSLTNIANAENNVDANVQAVSECTREQKAELVLLGFSREEISQKCGESGNVAVPSVTVNINNSNNNTNTNTQVVNQAENEVKQPSKPREHKPENFLLKFGVSMFSTSYDKDCVNCEIPTPYGYDFFHLHYYSNSIQPGSFGVQMNWGQILPSFASEGIYYDETTDSEVGTYEIEYINYARTLGIEYIAGSPNWNFYPGFAIMAGSLQQETVCSSKRNDGSHEDLCGVNDTIADKVEYASISGFSLTMYSKAIANNGSGASLSLTRLSSSGSDSVVGFSTIGIQLSAIW